MIKKSTEKNVNSIVVYKKNNSLRNGDNSKSGNKLDEKKE
jgi:hypothetical protein